ncbi:MAG: SURF1 family protein [Alphaproteobacteria bacterium]
MKKPPLWATLFTILGITILCTLGTWQIQRLNWKTEILSDLNAAYKNPRTELTHEALNTQTFAYGHASGTFQWDKAFKAGHKVVDGAAGANLILPLKTKNGDILINLGFMPQMHELEKHPLKRFNGKSIAITGLARTPDWNNFTPQNDPDKNLWYRLDIPQITTHFKLENPAPFILYAHESEPKISETLPDNTNWQPNNNHLQYALFWFAMALTLQGIFWLRFIRN